MLAWSLSNMHHCTCDAFSDPLFFHWKYAILAVVAKENFGSEIATRIHQSTISISWTAEVPTWLSLQLHQ
jgi:hypothetical protein